MFQIPEFEPSEQEDSSPALRGLGPSPTGDRPPGPGKHRQTAPGLLGEAGHQQGQPASSNHHGGAGAVETRSRHSSYPAGTEEDEGVEEEELSPFRGRSSSAPPNLCAALRYGRELRRMSDEFQGSFKGLPRPLPMTSPTARNSPPFPAPPAAILGVGGSLFRRLYARKRISSFLFEGGDLTQRPNSLPVCTRSTEGFGPVGSFEV
ncbi:bcl2-associated agonist of cell death isoform X1 [Neomonachus schauinslandi]|uniref:Bcl2-associated agonist of cell death isoform X1 n=1 Tax=Neomonachus schauinslandi TaxID=29088 RepID=A0A2Y9GTU5_NEOSC|nr:bcl2-associated agonist of cell death isoform X1 [Neomonachus schauinslandi]